MPFRGILSQQRHLPWNNQALSLRSPLPPADGRRDRPSYELLPPTTLRSMGLPTVNGPLSMPTTTPNHTTDPGTPLHSLVKSLTKLRHLGSLLRGVFWIPMLR